MEIEAVVKGVGIAAVSLLALSWLVVSFARSARTQSRVAWIAATSLYLALAALFTHLCRRAWEADSSLALVAFGFLLAVFVSGFLVSAVKTVRAFAAGGSVGSHATH